MLRIILSKIFVYFLRKLKVSVIIGVEITAKEKICEPQYNISFAWFTNLEGIGFKNWNECGFCRVNNLRPVDGENSVAAFKGTTNKQGEN